MKVGIIDAEMLFQTTYCEKGKHRFPNLASMKISGYHKSIEDKVTLITELPTQVSHLYSKYDKIYISKVFVETFVPPELLKMSIVEYGGTGFWYANAEPLSEMEHSMPDYHLYDDWIKERKELKSSTDEFTYYEDYSLGYSSRGCIRQCKFCINQHCTDVVKASPIKEFLNEDRNYICLLDDNILAYKNWREVFDELNATGKTFEFKQGLDIRALTEEKAEVIANSKININTLYFAFDNIKDKDIIEEKLALWRQYYRKNTHMYVLCGFDENNRYDEEFWSKDVEATLERIRICIKYGVFPYIMRYRKWNNAINPYRGMYVNLAAWCNQKSLFSKWSFNEWADKIQEGNEKQLKKKKLYSSKRYLMEYAGKFPDIAYKYFDLKYNSAEHNQYIYEKYKEENKPTKKLPKEILINIINDKKENIIDYPKVNIDILNYFKESTNIKAFERAINTTLTKDTLESIPINTVNLMFINIKNHNLDECEQNILKISKRYLNNSGELYVYNTNLKSFSLTKEFIEKNTELKFKEVTNFNVKKFSGGRSTEFCSRYLLNCNSKEDIFKTNYYNRVTLAEEIIQKSNTHTNIVLSFFDNFNYYNKLKNRNTKQWIFCNKNKPYHTKSALQFLNEIQNEKINYKQESILNNTKDKNIG